MYICTSHKPITNQPTDSSSIKVIQDIEVKVTNELKTSDLCYAMLKAVRSREYDVETVISEDPSSREKLNKIVQSAKLCNMHLRQTNTSNYSKVSIDFRFHIELEEVNCNVLDLNYMQEVLGFTFNVVNTRTFLDVKIRDSNIDMIYTEVNSNIRSSHIISSIDIERSYIETLVLNQSIRQVKIAASDVLISSEYILYAEGQGDKKICNTNLPKKIISPNLKSIINECEEQSGILVLDLYKDKFIEAGIDFTEDSLAVGRAYYNPESNVAVDEDSSVLFINTIYGIGCVLQNNVYRYGIEKSVMKAGITYNLISRYYLKDYFQIKNFNFKLPYNVKDTSIISVLNILEEDDTIKDIPFPGSTEHYYIDTFSFES